MSGVGDAVGTGESVGVADWCGVGEAVGPPACVDVWVGAPPQPATTTMASMARYSSRTIGVCTGMSHLSLLADGAKVCQGSAQFSLLCDHLHCYPVASGMLAGERDH